MTAVIDEALQVVVYCRVMRLPFSSGCRQQEPCWMTVAATKHACKGQPGGLTLAGCVLGAVNTSTCKHGELPEPSHSCMPCCSAGNSSKRVLHAAGCNIL